MDPQRKESEDQLMRQRQAKADASGKAQTKANERSEWQQKERWAAERQSVAACCPSVMSTCCCASKCAAAWRQTGK